MEPTVTNAGQGLPIVPKCPGEKRESDIGRNGKRRQDHESNVAADVLIRIVVAPRSRHLYTYKDGERCREHLNGDRPAFRGSARHLPVQCLRHCTAPVHRERRSRSAT